MIFGQGTHPGQRNLSEREPEGMAQILFSLSPTFPQGSPLARSNHNPGAWEPWIGLHVEHSPRAERLKTDREYIWRTKRGSLSLDSSDTAGPRYKSSSKTRRNVWVLRKKSANFRIQKENCKAKINDFDTCLWSKSYFIIIEYYS